jgi:hypothetical protein
MEFHEFLAILAIVCCFVATIIAVILAYCNNKATTKEVVSSKNNEDEIPISDALEHLKRSNSFNE